MLSSAKFLELLHPVRYTENFLDVFRLFWLSPADIYQVRFDVLPILPAFRLNLPILNSLSRSVSITGCPWETSLP